MSDWVHDQEAIDLVNAQYLHHNAFAKVRVFLGSEVDETGNGRRVAAKPCIQVDRSRRKEAWRFAMSVLDTLPDSASAARMRFVLAFAYCTGLCRAELSAARSPTTSVSDTPAPNSAQSTFCAS